jgi:hypothetical protein
MHMNRFYRNIVFGLPPVLAAQLLATGAPAGNQVIAATGAMHIGEHDSRTFFSAAPTARHSPF